jgi:DNA-binding NarL/FixJ family response regulator
MLSQGMSNADISAELSITDGTVKNHVSNILNKLPVKSRREITDWVNNYSEG